MEGTTEVKDTEKNEVPEGKITKINSAVSAIAYTSGYGRVAFSLTIECEF